MSQTLSGAPIEPSDAVSVTPPIRDPRTGDLVISMSKVRRARILTYTHDCVTSKYKVGEAGPIPHLTRSRPH